MDWGGGGAIWFSLHNIYKSIEIRKTVTVVGDHLGGHGAPGSCSLFPLT